MGILDTIRSMHRERVERRSVSSHEYVYVAQTILGPPTSFAIGGTVDAIGMKSIGVPLARMLVVLEAMLTFR